jgi:hypothetical protein
MLTLGRCVLTVACLLAGYALMLWGFRLMNLPSDRSLYSGLAVVLALLVGLPAAIRAIWRRRT